MIHLEIRIDMENATKGHYQLKGYIRVMTDSKISDIGEWMNTSGREKNRQKTFSLDIRFADAFSVKNTIIDLPGSVLLVQDIIGYPREIVDDKMAMNVLAAKNCDGIHDYMKELKMIQEKREEKCWIMSWMGGLKTSS